MNHKLHLLWIVAFIGSPFIFDVPSWVSVVFLILWSLKFSLYAQQRPGLPLWGTGLLSLGCLAGVWFNFNTLAGAEAGPAFLLLLLGLKIHEVRSYRDMMFTILLCFLIIMSKLLFSQSLATTVYMLVGVVLLVGQLITLHRTHFERDRLGGEVWSVTKLVLQAFPLVAFIFFMFPRFSNPLSEFLPQFSKASSGFSDDLRPGEISRLTLTDQLAFRVYSNDEDFPPMDRRYWRGAVLEESQGLSWKRLPLTRNHKPAPTEGNFVSYDILIEPQFRKWLFGLETPVSMVMVDTSLRIRIIPYTQGVFQIDKDMPNAFLYRVNSTFRTTPGELTESEKALFTQVPDIRDPRLDRLIQQLKKEAPTDDDKIRALWNFFASERFEYTLTPGVLGADPLNEFLFESKKGFCEHFAGAFATLARMLGVPSRVVVGFHGGLINEFGNFLVVKSQDAHAWTEIWLNQKWQRFDPTSIVAPARLSLGGAAITKDKNSFFNETLRVLQFAKIARAWDALTSGWELFLINYDFQFQKELLMFLGFENISKSLLWLATLVGSTVIGILVFVFMKESDPRDPVEKLLDRFSRRLKKAGVRREAHEGFVAWSENAIAKLPDHERELNEIFEEFIKTRYSPSPSLAQLKTLRQKVFNLKI